jgi:tetratricopeptide (TPR) repeat protein
MSRVVWSGAFSPSRGKILAMRPRALVVLIGMIGLIAMLEACAARTVPVPMVTTPKYPEFVLPAIPSAFVASPAVAHQDLAWRFLQSGDLRNADREIAVALQGTPDFYPAEATSGWIAIAKREPRNALTHFDRVLERQVNYISALIGRAQALVALERDVDAAASLEAALAADPALTDLRRQIDVLKFRGAEKEIAAARQAARANRVDEARRAYQHAITNSPDSAFLYRELAALERQAQESDAALEHYRKALDLDPSDAGSMAQIGELLEARGELEAALQSYERALAIEPGPALSGRRDALRSRIELARMPDEYRAIGGAPQITRAQLAALIGIQLGPWVRTMPAADAGVITDIRGTWAENWIMAVTRAAVMEPYANHTFQPDAVVRRVDLAPIASRLIVRLAPSDQARSWQMSRAVFSDLQSGHLAYPAASTAVASGVMTAAPDGAFQPSLPVTGQEAIAMVERLQRLAGPAPTSTTSGR